MTMSRDILDRIGQARLSVEDALRDGLIQVEGNSDRLTALFGMLDRFSADFNIVSPPAGADGL